MTWKLSGQWVSLESMAKTERGVCYLTGIDQGDAGNQPVAAEVVKEPHGKCQLVKTVNGGFWTDAARTLDSGGKGGMEQRIKASYRQRRAGCLWNRIRTLAAKST